MVRILFLGETPLGRKCRRWLEDHGLRTTLVSGPITQSDHDLGVSVGYRYIVPATVLAQTPIVNLHTGLLPYNRGAYPNVWPLIDGTPAGVTLHWMDDGLDTGDVIARHQVPVEPWDTAYTLDHRLKDAAFELFQATWPRILDQTAPRSPQVGPWTEHRKADLASVTFRLDQTMPVERVLAILRARSYPGYSGVQVTENGHTWEVALACRPVD